MIEAPSHLIRASSGRVRVLRLAIVDGHTVPCAYVARLGSGTCRACGRTDVVGCMGGCAWVDSQHTVCTRCFKRSMLP